MHRASSLTPMIVSSEITSVTLTKFTWLLHTIVPDNGRCFTNEDFNARIMASNILILSILPATALFSNEAGLSLSLSRFIVGDTLFQITNAYDSHQKFLSVMVLSEFGLGHFDTITIIIITIIITTTSSSS